MVTIMQNGAVQISEDPPTVDRDVAMLRKKLLLKKGLRARTDYEFLLAFLRAKKFDVKRSYDTVKNFYKMRKNYAAIFGTVTPSTLKHVYNAGINYPLVERDQHGRVVMLFHWAKWDPAVITFEDLLKMAYLNLQKLMENPEVQMNGLVTVDDMEFVTCNHFFHATPSQINLCHKFLHKCIPVRVKKMHFVNAPTWIDKIARLIMPLLTKKLQSRIHFYCANYASALEADIGSDHLPKAYGGKRNETLDDLQQKWTEYMLSCEDEFTENLEYGYIDD